MGIPFTSGYGPRRPDGMDKHEWKAVRRVGAVTYDGPAVGHPGLLPHLAAVHERLVTMQNTNAPLVQARDAWEIAHLSEAQLVARAAALAAEGAEAIAAGEAAADLLGDREAASIRSESARWGSRVAEANRLAEEARVRAEHARLQVALASAALTDEQMVYATTQMPQLQRWHALINDVRAYWQMTALEALPDDLPRQLVQQASRRVRVDAS